jgi:flagella basal body P-ring formation protein FlgA
MLGATAALVFTATATALRTGFVGDTIALKARSSEEEFDAVVTGQNRVEIVQGGSR